VARAAVVAGRAQVPDKFEGGRAPSAPMVSGRRTRRSSCRWPMRSKARAMARALLRGASAELDPLRRREVHSVRVRRGRGHNEGMGVVG